MWYSDGVFYPNMPSKHDIVAEWIDNSHIERTKRMIEVMQAYVDGRWIEFKSSCMDSWKIMGLSPSWDWATYDFRIAEAKTHDSINWDHVAPEFNYMARDEDGEVWFYKNKPEMLDKIWYNNQSEMAEAWALASYRRGTVDWKDSLVMRPGVED